MVFLSHIRRKPVHYRARGHVPITFIAIPSSRPVLLAFAVDTASSNNLQRRDNVSSIHGTANVADNAGRTVLVALPPHLLTGSYVLDARIFPHNLEAAEFCSVQLIVGTTFMTVISNHRR